MASFPSILPNPAFPRSIAGFPMIIPANLGHLSAARAHTTAELKKREDAVNSAKEEVLQHVGEIIGSLRVDSQYLVLQSKEMRNKITQLELTYAANLTAYLKINIAKIDRIYQAVEAQKKLWESQTVPFEEYGNECQRLEKTRQHVVLGEFQAMQICSGMFSGNFGHISYALENAQRIIKDLIPKLKENEEKESELSDIHDHKEMQLVYSRAGNVRHLHAEKSAEKTSQKIELLQSRNASMKAELESLQEQKKALPAKYSAIRGKHKQVICEQVGLAKIEAENCYQRVYSAKQHFEKEYTKAFALMKENILVTKYEKCFEMIDPVIESIKEISTQLQAFIDANVIEEKSKEIINPFQAMPAILYENPKEKSYKEIVEQLRIMMLKENLAEKKPQDVIDSIKELIGSIR